jgi:anhydro-N-acetylmuramic acid kinase
LNIGGIANVTGIPAGAPASKVAAFDTGPGNMVIDQLVTAYTRGTRHYDEDGALAGRGRVSRWLLHALMRDSYFRKAPPKSAGREEYGDDFIEHLVNTRLPMEDLIATASAFTVQTIAQGIRRFLMPKMRLEELVLSGGGSHNRFLVEMLERELAELTVKKSSDFGIDVDAKEAIAFAVLAHETWNGKASNLPSATGASKPVILGKISPGPRDKLPLSPPL